MRHSTLLEGLIERLNLYLFPADISEAPSLTYSLDIQLEGLVGLHTIDNLVIIHHKVHCPPCFAFADAAFSEHSYLKGFRPSGSCFPRPTARTSATCVHYHPNHVIVGADLRNLANGMLSSHVGGLRTQLHRRRQGRPFHDVGTGRRGSMQPHCG